MATIAQRLFDSVFAESELEDALSEAGLCFERLGWDYYDCSLEIYGVKNDDRLSVDVQRVIYLAGFATAYVNHADKWETHYNFNQKTDFVESKGWRISYPHKRGEKGGKIMVETMPTNWPSSWLENGSVVIVTKPAPSTQDQPQ